MQTAGNVNDQQAHKTDQLYDRPVKGYPTLAKPAKNWDIPSGLLSKLLQSETQRWYRMWCSAPTKTNTYWFVNARVVPPREAKYERHLLGPHSKIVDDEAEQLALSSLIRHEPGKISLTMEGKQTFDGLKRGAKEIQKIREFKELLNDLTRDELLAFTCFSYPASEPASESWKYENIRKRRKKLALSTPKGQDQRPNIRRMFGGLLEELKIHQEKTQE